MHLKLMQWRHCKQRRFIRLASSYSRYPPCKPLFNCSNYSNYRSYATDNGVSIGKVEPTLAMIYTCKKCDTRSAQTFSKDTYENGTVMVQCPGCHVIHLVADNKGIFTDEKSNIFDYIKQGDGKTREAMQKISSQESMVELLKNEGVTFATGQLVDEGVDDIKRIKTKPIDL